jgi:hypothetical protein
MYALINKQKMELVCRFPDLNSRTEAHKNPPFVTINLEDEGELNSSFTLLELQLLYRSLGSVMGTTWIKKSSVRHSVFRLIDARPVASPSQVQLFEPYTPPTASAGDGTGPRQQGAVASTQAKTAPRTGNRAVIWEVADRMWNEAGSPLDVPRMLELRKAIMDNLGAEHGIKRTTSSTALGEWQKARLNG